MAVASGVVAVALLVGAFALTALLRNRLVDNLDATLATQALDRAALIESGADPAELTTTLLHEAVVWIGLLDETTVATGGKYLPVGPPAGTTPGTTTVEVSLEHAQGESESERMRVTTVTTTDPDGTTLVIAIGSELEVIDNPVQRVQRILLVGIPGLILLVAALTWFTADRALRPVEAIRSAAASISGSGLDTRVPQPGTNDEIERLATTVNEMLDRLAAHDRRQRRFIGDASHELKSPLANLQAELETIEATDPAWPDTRARLVAQTTRLAGIVDDLLALASSEALITARPVDLDDVVFDVLELATPTSAVKFDIDGVRPVRVLGDAAQLRRVVRNLVDNAIRHANEVVALELDADDEFARLQVRDDGPGIPAEDRERVFERFTRLDDARARDAGGTGLSLAIVRQIVDRHGGRVEVDDALEGGAIVTVKLPLSE
jgi:signal transduction histidine kinase